MNKKLIRILGAAMIAGFGTSASAADSTMGMRKVWAPWSSSCFRSQASPIGGRTMACVGV